jgi:type II secretory pathway predicted ATPase ExeA/septal ring-binding cell division protein DamX
LNNLYLNHFGLSEAPYRITPHTDFFFEGANRGTTLDALVYTITHDEGIVKVTGEVGSGKTMLCRVLMERLPQNVETIYLANPSLGRDEIMMAISDDLKVSATGQRSSLLLRALQERLIELYAAGRQVVVLIDEAHAMPVETLEEIRLLSNLESKRHKLLQIVLFGQQELDEVLGTPQMRQLKDRIVHSFRLEPLVRSDVGTYLMFRMRHAGYKGPDLFTAGAIRLISEASEGLTRRINILADKALLAAFADGGYQILPKHVSAAIADSEFTRVKAGPRMGLSTTTLAVAAVGLIATGAAAALLAVYIAIKRAPWMAQPNPAAAASQAPPSAPPVALPQKALGTSDRPPGPNPSVAPAPSVSSAPLSATPPAGALPAISPARAAEEAKSPATPPAGNVPNQDATQSVTPTPALDRRLRATELWLERSPATLITVQLLVADGARAREVDTWIARPPQGLDAEKLYVINSVIRGAEKIAILYGSYPDRAAAAAAIASLPKPVRDGKPIVRSVGGIRSDRKSE